MYQGAKKGFTLIELMLSMTFISILLLTIALTVIQIGTIYNKGLTMKDLNQAVRSIGDDFKRSAASSAPMVVSNDYVTSSAGGRICLGAYSYIWNTKSAIAKSDVNLTSYQSNPAKTVQLVKVPDTAKLYCSKDINGVLVYKQIRSVDDSVAQELLPPGDHNIGINSLTLDTNAVVQDTTIGEALYTLAFILSAGDISAMTTDGSACLGPKDKLSDLTYCSVQQFRVVIEAGHNVY